MAEDTMSGAESLVAQGVALIRIENETMMQVAVQRPRDEAAVVKGALSELDLVPEEAQKAYYSIPYRERQQDGSVKITKVEGPSIKAAMTLARRWGNCTTGARILQEDKEGYDIEGVFIDLETNFRITRPHRTSKWYKPRGGGMQLLSVDRQLMAVQAGASKALRNAILAGLPAYLVSAYDKKARAIVGGKLDDPAEAKTIAAVLKAFSRWSVTKEQLERYAELPADKWTGTEVADLRGLYNAILDGQTTVDEVFREEKPAEAVPQQAGSTVVTPESLLGGQASGMDGAQPGLPAVDLPALGREGLLTICQGLAAKAGVRGPQLEKLQEVHLGRKGWEGATVDGLTAMKEALEGFKPGKGA